MKFNEYNNPANPDQPRGFIYKQWKDYKKKIGRYCLIPNEIIQYLPLLNGPELNLYIFYAINADNTFGNSFYSIETIAQELNVSAKTINNWNNKLIDLGLITRVQPIEHKSAEAQLLPLTSFIARPSSSNLERTRNQLEKANYKITDDLHLVIFHKNNKLTPLKFTIYYRDGPSTVKDNQIKRGNSKLSNRNTDSKNEGPKWLIAALQEPNYELSETDKNIINKGNIPWKNHESGQVAWIDHKNYFTLLIKNYVENENDDAKLLDTLCSFATKNDILKFRKNYRHCKIRV